MNGIDPVVATGNDWRGIGPGPRLRRPRGDLSPLGGLAPTVRRILYGELVLPMAVATVGGTLRVHPGSPPEPAHPSA